MNKRDILSTKGKISASLASKKASIEYKKYKSRVKEQEKLESIKQLDEDLRRLEK